MNTQHTPRCRAKVVLPVLLVAIALSAGFLSRSRAASPDTEKAAKSKKSDEAKGKAQGKSDGRLLHVVSFKFKESATKEQIREVEEAFEGLKGKISEIASLEWGTNVSPENLNKGFTHCWVIAFNSEADRDAYLVHPEHKEFVALVGPVVGDAFVIDFWAKTP